MINIEQRLCSVIKSREGGRFMATWVGGKTSFYIRVRLEHILTSKMAKKKEDKSTSFFL